MAMDMDALTQEQKEQYMKERCCFKCGKVGHRANICQSGLSGRGQAKGKKETLIAQIGELSEQEQNEVLEGFL